MIVKINMGGDIEFHNCLQCNTEFDFEININLYINCYKKCKYYYYFDNNNYYNCTENLICPSEYPILIEGRNECVFDNIKYLENIINSILNNEFNITNIEKGKEEEINNYNKILDKIESIFTSNNFDLKNIDKGNDQIINANKILITFTSTENQRNNIESNMSTIDLGNCEDLLRKYYNLTNNQTIYMKKIDIIQEELKTKKVEYNVYYKLSGKNLVKLNLTICQNTKISINIPYEIKGNIDKFNISSGYYNDICYPAISKDGTDISLNDRKIEYIEGDNIICQEDCDFSYYDPITKKAKCECLAKESDSTFSDMFINKTKLFENLKDIKNLMNLNILICYKQLLAFTNIFYNIGCLIIIFIIIFHIFSMFVFYLNQLKIINKKIRSIIFAKINMSLLKKNNKNIKIFKKNKICNKIEKSNSIIDSKRMINKKSNNKKSNNKKNNNKKSNNKIIFNVNYIINKNNNNNKININNKMKYNNEELNELSYNYALLFDKRKFCQYYKSLLKAKHNLIFAFCNNEDYNPKIIKIDLFFIGITIDYTINALFFNDDTMHEIYVKKGKYDFETQIPIAIYSYLISALLNIPIAFLGLSNDKILHFKQNQGIKDIKKKGNKLMSFLKIKFSFYFIISFIFLLFFWYYISLFGIIYKNTQYHLLKDTLISFGFSIF